MNMYRHHVLETTTFAKKCKSDWQASRHVVELDVLANGLKNCILCSQHLFLENCISNSCSITGLAAISSIRCVLCNVVNTVPTGKKHGNVLEHKTLNRVKESGRAVEQLAKESVDISLQNEVRLQGLKDIEVSVDAGWQKRVSGKSYDSLSGSYKAGNLAMTTAAKRQRNKLKVERNKKRTVNELHKGPMYMYQSYLAFENGEALPETVPEAVYTPSADTLQTIHNRIFFDLETSRLGRKEHIIQIAARRGQKKFQH